MTSLHTKLEILQIKVNKQEHYLWLNCLLIHGLEVKKNESTDGLVLETINTKLEFDLQIEDIDHTNKIGKYRKDHSG